MNANIITSIEERILIISVNRPEKLNALSIATLKDFEEAIKEVYENSSVGGAVITGSGDKAFVAGADIEEFQSLTPFAARAYAQNGQRVLALIENCPKPIVAAINGYALGGGCELAASCHMRVLAESAFVGLPEVKLGIIPGFGGTQRLIQLIGKSKATEYMLSGRFIDSKEAQDLGFANYTVPDDKVLQKSKHLLLEILENSSSSISGILTSINSHFRQDGYLTELNQFQTCFAHSDRKEGVDAFLQKRKPNFS